MASFFPLPHCHGRPLVVVGLGLCFLSSHSNSAMAEEREAHRFYPQSVLESAVLESGARVVSPATRIGAHSDLDTSGLSHSTPQQSQGFPERAAPDRATGRHESLPYQKTFTPSVAPLKRVQVYDTMNARLELVARPTVRDPWRPVATADINQDSLRYRARFRLSLNQDGALMPSVSPDMNLISYQASPKVPIAFKRDRAGRYWVEGPDGVEVSLQLHIAVGRHYSSSGQMSQTPLNRLGSNVYAELPDEARRVGKRWATKLGLTEKTTVASASNTLASFFNAFEVASLEPDGRAGFESIMSQRKGVCRHRAWAFFIVARSIGLPTRVIYNESHAFVEVYDPLIGWVAINLGGAPIDMAESLASDPIKDGQRDPRATPAGQEAPLGDDTHRDGADGPKAQSETSAHEDPYRWTVELESSTPVQVVRGGVLSAPLKGRVLNRTTGKPAAEQSLGLALYDAQGRQLARLPLKGRTDRLGYFQVRPRFPSDVPRGRYEFRIFMIKADP